jgi:threonine synthase
VTTTTTISGLAVAQDLDGSAIVRAYGAAGARGILVSDADILAAQASLARAEGILVEPAGAASVAGLIAAAQAGRLEPDRVIVCLLTGHGLKDLTSLGAIADSSPVSLIPRSEIGTVLEEEPTGHR